MQYPLEEKIGPPELLVGRLNEFTNFNKWLYGIPGRLSKSRVILARRKSGKTSFVQRIFNQLWSDNGQVVPFYFDIADKDIWLYDLALKYYRAFIMPFKIIMIISRAMQDIFWMQLKMSQMWAQRGTLPQKRPIVTPLVQNDAFWSS